MGPSLTGGNRQASDGGYIIAGANVISGEDYHNAWIIKLDADGVLEWQNSYGGSSGDAARAVEQDSDGGFILSGYTYSYGAGDSDLWVLKLDKEGKIRWQKTYGGWYGEWGDSIQPTKDKGYVIAGIFGSFGAGYSDFLVVKLDTNGNIQWQKAYGGIYPDQAKSIKQTPDGGYVVAGWTQSFGTVNSDRDVLVLKLNKRGKVIWQKTYGDPSGADEAYSINNTFDGGFIVGGYTYPYGAGYYDSWVLKLDSDGNIEWQKTYGGRTEDVYTYINSIEQTSDGGYIAGGYIGPLNIYSDAWILKLDAKGKIVWQKTWGGYREDFVNSVLPTHDGGYIAVGRGDGGLIYGALILKFDKDGDIPGCSLCGTSDVVALDSNALPHNVNVNVTQANAVQQVSPAVQRPTFATASEICYHGVTLLLPEGGEIIPSMTTYPITWKASADAVTFDLRYSMNGGRNWTLITSGLTGTSYDWPVPKAKNQTSCLIEINGYDASSNLVDTDRSNSTFTIRK